MGFNFAKNEYIELCFSANILFLIAPRDSAIKIGQCKDYFLCFYLPNFVSPGAHRVRPPKKSNQKMTKSLKTCLFSRSKKINLFHNSLPHTLNLSPRGCWFRPLGNQGRSCLRSYVAIHKLDLFRNGAHMPEIGQNFKTWARFQDLKSLKNWDFPSTWHTEIAIIHSIFESSYFGFRLTFMCFIFCI